MNEHHRAACNTCPHRSPPPYAGRMDCLYDPKRPVDTQERLADGACPAGRFGAGDTIAKVIKAVTFGKVKECGGCKKRRAKLNRLMPKTK